MEETGRYPGEPWWEACYAVVYLVTAAIVEAGPVGGPGRIAVSAALVAMVPWYVFMGRPLPSALPVPSGSPRTAAPVAGAPASWRAPLYLVGLIALFAVVGAGNPAGWLLAFALCPMALRLEKGLDGIVFVVAINAVAGLQAALWKPSLAIAAVGAAAFAIGLSIVFSRWMRAVIAQSEERAGLITELSQAREQLAEAHHEAGVLAERHRLAGEIHDTLAQGFTSIVTLIQAATAGLEPGTDARGHLDLALRTARENLAEARALVTALSPAQLDGSTLGDAITRVAQAAGNGGDTTIRSEVSGVKRSLPTATEVVLLRVAQEALANVRKHAAARQVDVGLCYADGAVRLTVADDGRGFDAEAASDGYGLRGMRDRVRQAGGTIAVTSAPGEGTVVRAEVPA
ncbi:MAG: sensor histidine kinase [Nocardiopsaceae bacterium]|nr:sensor histidine kinase [Nocardiopsaceae bacterium]